jgi:hypothetical protein
MNGQAGLPNRAVVDPSELLDSPETGGSIDYASDIDEFHRAFRDALRTLVDDAIVEFGSYAELRERLSSVMKVFVEEFSEQVLLSSVARLNDGFWQRLEKSFLNCFRDPKDELDEIRKHVRQVWGEHSSAEMFLEDLLSYVGKSPVEELSLGELRSAAHNLDSDAEVDQLAFWFSAGEQALMAVRFRLRSDGNEDRLLGAEQLSEALHTGELFDLDSRELVERFSDNVFPYFVILRRLRRLAEEQAK